MGSFQSISSSHASPNQNVEPLVYLPDHSGLAQIIVKFKTTGVDLDQAQQQLGLLSKSSGLPLSTVEPLPYEMWLYTVNVPELERYHVNASTNYKALMTQGLKQLNALPSIRFAEQNELMHSTSNLKTNLVLRNNTRRPSSNVDQSQQWDMFGGPGGIFARCATFPNCSFPVAWNITKGTSKFIVAVIDTGIANNDNLNANVVLPGWNFVNNTADVTDSGPIFHGEHVSGTVAALGPTVFGVGSFNKVLPVKVLSDAGSGSESNLLKGVAWAIGDPVPGAPLNLNPSKILNISLGQDVICPDAMVLTFNEAYAKGVSVFAASGNFNEDSITFSPADCPHVTSIAATTIDGLRAFYSNFGSQVAIAAPGGAKDIADENGILSTLGDNTFAFYQGTSMATPHVAGVTALLYSVKDFQTSTTANPSDLVETVLVNTVSPFAPSLDPEVNCKGIKSCGVGIVNAYQAVNAMNQNKAIAVSPTMDTTVPSLNLSSGVGPGVFCPAGQVLATAPQFNQLLSNGTSLTWQRAYTTCSLTANFNQIQLSINQNTKQLTLVYGMNSTGDYAAIYKANFPANYKCSLIDKSTKIGCLQN